MPRCGEHDPLKLSEDAGRLYGLGTADMKSFLGLAIEAARGLKAKDLKQPLIILATADEESAMHGAHALVNAGRPLGRYAVIGEPTGLPAGAHAQGRDGGSGADDGPQWPCQRPAPGQ